MPGEHAVGCGEIHIFPDGLADGSVCHTNGEQLSPFRFADEGMENALFLRECEMETVTTSAFFTEKRLLAFLQIVRPYMSHGIGVHANNAADLFGRTFLASKENALNASQFC